MDRSVSHEGELRSENSDGPVVASNDRVFKGDLGEEGAEGWRRM